MPGHLFVVHGDLLQLVHDAWLAPTDCLWNVTAGWRLALGMPPDADRLDPAARGLVIPSSWGHDGRVCPLPDEGDGSRAWLCDVGSHAGEASAWYAEGVRQFLDTASRDLADRKPARRRERPLLALPVVGTGAGGQARTVGAVVEPIVQAIKDFLSGTDLEVDVALVARDEAHFTAALAARRRLMDETQWSDLSPELQLQAKDIARQAQSGGLVLFIGAGVSAAAGVPGWDGLLDRLAETCDVPELQRDALRQLPHLDRAEYLERHLNRNATQGQRLSLGGKIRELLTPHKRYSLGHALLAGLPVDQIVTTNYDDLTERACKAVGREVVVLPHAPARDQRHRWLLKLHGSIERPDDIVLTRSNYLRYETWRSALSGIVQGALLTHKMWFVGFSFTDDNFHRIVDAVRRALHGGDSAHGKAIDLGWATLLESQPLFEQLWQEEIDWLRLGGAESSVTLAAARRFEILLDLVSDQAAGTAWLLNDDFRDARQPLDEELAKLLKPLMDAKPELRQHGAWGRVEALLHSLGAKREPVQPDR